MSLRLLALTYALFASVVAASLAPAAFAAPGFLPPRGDDILLDTDGAYLDGAFAQDGSFEILYGNDSVFAGGAFVRRHLPFTDGTDGRELNFGSYGDVDTLDTVEDGFAVAGARIATDVAGNSVAAWSTLCDDAGGGGEERCVKAAVRPAGGAWSEAVSVTTTLTDVAQSAPVLVAIRAGIPVVAFVREDATGEARGAAVVGDMTGAWSAAQDLLPEGVPSDTGGASRHLNGLAFDDSGAVWAFIISSGASGVGDEHAYVARRAPDGTWGRVRVGTNELSEGASNNAVGSIAFGGDTGVIAWSRLGGDEVVVTSECSVADGTCGQPRQASAAGVDGRNARVAVDDDGNAIVTWLQADASGLHSIVSAYGERQDPALAWDEVEVMMPAVGTTNGVMATFESGRFTHDVAFAVDGTAIAAWSWDDNSAFPYQRATFGARRDPGAAAAWSTVPLDAARDSSGVRRVHVVSDGFGDAAVVWARENGAADPVVQVAPLDVTGPRIADPVFAPLVTAGTSTSLSTTLVDTWSAVADTDVRWFIDGSPITATGRTVTGCFLTPGTTSVSVEATDAAGNVSTTDTFTFEVVGSATSCGGSGDPTPDPGTGGDGGSSGGGSTDGGSTGGGTTTPPVETTPPPAPPSPFTFTDTTTRDKVPAVVGLKASTARDRFDRAGINVDFEIRMVSRAKAPRGITIGEVMAQTPRAGTLVETAIRDRQEVRLDVYAGPVVGRPSASGCAVAKVNAAVKGLELDLAKLVLKSMKCPYQVDVRPVAKGDDAAVTGATSKRGLITLGVNIPRKPTNNDVLLTFRENPNGISFDKDNWTLTAGQKNAFTFQATTEVLVKGKIPLIEKASVWIDMSGVGGARNLTGQTGPLGEKVTILEPPRAGYIDILVEYQAGNDVSLWGTARLKVVDRSGAKAGSTLATVSGRVFQKHRTGTWVHVPGASMPKSRARDARFLDFGAMVTWMQHAVAGIGGSIGSAFSTKGQSSEQVLSTALKHAKVSPSQVLIHDSLVSGNVKPIELRAADVVSAGGGNVVAAGGGNVIAPGGANVIAPGGANVISAGGGNVVAAGGGNVISAGGANGIAASAPGLIAMGAAGVISASGGNVIAPGGANVISAGGGNLLSDNGLGRRP